MQAYILRDTLHLRGRLSQTLNVQVTVFPISATSSQCTLQRGAGSNAGEFPDQPSLPHITDPRREEGSRSTQQKSVSADSPSDAHSVHPQVHHLITTGARKGAAVRGRSPKWHEDRSFRKIMRVSSSKRPFLPLPMDCHGLCCPKKVSK